MSSSPVSFASRVRGSIFGALVGDAFGSPYQFRKRGTYEITDDMEPCATYGVPAGAYTDDGSMMLCLAESLLEAGFDLDHQMHTYWVWLAHGHLSSVPKKGAFDIGGTTMQAISKYGMSMQPGCYGLRDPYSSGNGGIMRLAPVPLFFSGDHYEAVRKSAESSAVTHASDECVESAMLLGHVLQRLATGASKDEALDTNSTADWFQCPKVRAIARGAYKTKTASKISTTGYVIHTLEAALWALHVHDSFESGMKTLASMGDDVDTVCCVYGQLAGALYGFEAIPTRWVDGLLRRKTIDGIVDPFVRACASNFANQ